MEDGVVRHRREQVDDPAQRRHVLADGLGELGGWQRDHERADH